MKLKSWVWVVCWMVFLVLNATGVRAAQKPSACVTCHQTLGGAFSKPVVDWRGSVHQQVGVTCDKCHGGNAAVAVGNVKQLSGAQFESKRLAAMSKSHGFVARPSGRALFDMCAKCHADTVARFSESIMGKAYLENKGGPSCLTCHHAHNNVIPDVPKVCTQCHKDTTGFTQIDPMNVTDATIARLSTIRIRLAGEKAQGSRPSLVPKVPEELDPYQVGLLAFGGVVVLFLIGLLIFVILEKEE